MGPYQGFGGLGRSVINFQGAGEQANFFCGFREEGSEEKHERELGEWLFFFQGQEG